jgi:hypothetical protein
MKQIASGPARIHDSVWTSSQGLERQLQHLVEISIKLVGADKGTMQLYDEREKVLKLITSVGFDEESVEAFRGRFPSTFRGTGTPQGHGTTRSPVLRLSQPAGSAQWRWCRCGMIRVA